VISPILWNIYIADLAQTLNSPENKPNLDSFLNADQIKSLNRALLFADDLVVKAISDQMLKQAWKEIYNWSILNDVEINKKKSGCFYTKVDQRTPNELAFSLYGIP
jgi:hypothetical protein